MNGLRHLNDAVLPFAVRARAFRGEDRTMNGTGYGRHPSAPSFFVFFVSFVVKKGFLVVVHNLLFCMTRSK
jgi:hypothetical protein